MDRASIVIIETEGYVYDRLGESLLSDGFQLRRLSPGS